MIFSAWFTWSTRFITWPETIFSHLRDPRGLTFSPRTIMTKRMFCLAYVDDDVGTEVCYDEPVFCVVHVDDDVFSQVNHDQTNVPLSLRG